MKSKPCEVDTWATFPLIMRTPDVMKLGFGENEARALLNHPDCPSIEYGTGKGVEKYALKRFLQRGVKKSA